MDSLLHIRDMAQNLQVWRTRECEPEGARAKEGVDAGEAADQGQAHAQAQPQPDPPRVGPGLIKMSERQSDVQFATWKYLWSK